MLVLITRQEEKSKEFASMLNNKNIKNLAFPVLDIETLMPTDANLSDLDKSNFLIFTSQNSVIAFMDLFSKADLIGKKVASIGIATKNALEKFHINVDVSPKEDFTSEKLLEEITRFKLKNELIVIIKGKEGRSFLRDELSKKYNVLDDINIYERKISKKFNEIDITSLNEVSHICITSVDILKNLLEIYLLLGLQIKESVFFVAGNERIEKEIKKVFLSNRTIVADNPTNEAMLNAILAHNN
tara:strand:+ start:205 stop:933 length:729 start_codon:yes stop_codon:yes gene_type:complete